MINKSDSAARLSDFVITRTIKDRIGLHLVLLPLLRGIPNKLVLEPSTDYFKSPCLLELRMNAIEVDLRVPGNDIEFPFPQSYFPSIQ